MIEEKLVNEYYTALIEKDSQYEGIFVVGVKTTGIFCRPTCPARKPKFSSCEFFKTVEEALLASYRPCKRCRPLSSPGCASDLIQKLVEAVEREPEKRWKERDFARLGVDVSTVRRQFKKRFGMTFVQYARARRMGIAMKEIRNNQMVIDAQLSIGYESGSGFRDAFSKIMKNSPARSKTSHCLKAHWIDTPLGPMVAMGDEHHLHLLEFVDRRGLEREVEKLHGKYAIVPGMTKPLQSIEEELKLYFSGNLKSFQTPIYYHGSDFQKKVWDALQKIDYGVTISYAELAKGLFHPKAFRAVARANGANQLALIVPCHRVINSNGELGGYGGKVPRKKWLIEHEKMFR